MPEVVINACYGGFGLSHKATMALAGRKGIKLYVEPTRETAHIWGEPPEDLNEYGGMISYFTVPPEQYHELSDAIKNDPERDYRELPDDWYFGGQRDIERDDPDLLAVVKELGDEANGRHAKLRIVEVPDDVEWVIDEYDGLEQVEEAHRAWS